jgi:NTE family protein
MNVFSGIRTLITCLLSFGVLLGCSSYGVVKNEATDQTLREGAYSLGNQQLGDRSDDITFILTFSGGGTRAAAMAYGVMEELRDTEVYVDGKQRRLLDEVDHISSVSGGSFAAAYYGLHGEHMFDIFEDDFLRFDLQGKLTRSILNPFHWFGRKGRTERSIDIYNEYLFHDATYADMMKPNRPMIIINASDLSHGVRFSFVQEYFNMLCSDLKTFPVARAVTASSAVPIVFNPVVLQNHDGCPDVIARNEASISQRSRNDPELKALFKGLKSYSDKEKRKYVHFVDGGITDNMGLRAVSDVISVTGGPKQYLDRAGRKTPTTVVFIAVNASTEPAWKMDASVKQPSIGESMGAVSGVQLHRYNVATIELVKKELETWVEGLSTPERPAKSYFIQVTFEDIKQPQLKLFLNKIPTSFSLTDEQVDTLTDSARELLRNEPTFQELLSELAKP